MSSTNIEIVEVPTGTFRNRAWRCTADYTLFTLHAPDPGDDRWVMSWQSGDAGGYDVASDPRQAITGALSTLPDRALAAQLVEAFAATARSVLSGVTVVEKPGVTLRIAYDVTGLVDGLTEAHAATAAAFPWLAEARAYQAELERAGRLTPADIDAAVAAYAKDLMHLYLCPDCDREIEAAARRTTAIRTVADLDARAAEIQAAPA